MPKKLTPWVTDITKNPTPVTPVVKNAALWGKRARPYPALYTSSTKKLNAWGHSTALQTYTYDDRFTYNDPLVSYNFLVNGNTANQLGQTLWKAT